MVFAQPVRPFRKPAPDLVEDDKSLIQLDSVPLTVVESDCFNMRESF